MAIRIPNGQSLSPGTGADCPLLCGAKTRRGCRRLSTKSAYRKDTKKQAFAALQQKPVRHSATRLLLQGAEIGHDVADISLTGDARERHLVAGNHLGGAGDP